MQPCDLSTIFFFFCSSPLLQVVDELSAKREAEKLYQKVSFGAAEFLPGSLFCFP